MKNLAGYIFSTVLFLAVGGVRAEGILPIFDTHVHYSEDAWGIYPPAVIFEKLKTAGVVRALVSSTPDDGTLKLLIHNAGAVAPLLRPYRKGGESSTWYADPDVLAYVLKRLKSGIYKGVGEFHLFDRRSALTPQMRSLVKEVVKRNIVLQVHSGADPVEALFSLSSKLRIVWAHAGMSEAAATVGRLMDAYKNLWTEVSFRASEIDGGEDWKKLMLRHPDRFMIGTDTYITERWSDYKGLIDEHRQWLLQLPEKTAEAIAFGNAVRLFGAGQGTGLN